ncbi:hypothetical protein PoB_006131500 [Plakobranchus ocellatus]|uniref:Uncharacterized protein n=1 Tax=Plakobranchus ocellatus TaxID=259542 RepID=A0AAV4CSI6_9GAST|nr:hypothetical protein PoB_006131500 [Plakobranchus ocellatus]
MALQTAVSGMYDRLHIAVDYYNMHSTGVVTALLAGGVTVLSGLHIYNRYRRHQLRLKMEARGQRAKKDIEDMKQDLKSKKVTTVCRYDN